MEQTILGSVTEIVCITSKSEVSAHNNKSPLLLLTLEASEALKPVVEPPEVHTHMHRGQYQNIPTI